MKRKLYCLVLITALISLIPNFSFVAGDSNLEVNQLRKENREEDKAHPENSDLSFLDSEPSFLSEPEAITFISDSNTDSHNKSNQSIHNYTVQEIVDYASLGYCKENEIYTDDHRTELSLKTFRSEEGSWEYGGGEIFKKDYKFGFHIMVNHSEKKVVLSFSGTKNFEQLIDEFLHQEGRNIFGEKIEIMDYFHKLYKDTHAHFLSCFTDFVAKHFKPPRMIEEYVFVFSGHSLGASMATVYLFDVVKNKHIPVTKKSPVLITIGQPRTGNFVFANEFNKMAAQTIRIIQEGDFIVGLPRCKTFLNYYLQSSIPLRKSTGVKSEAKSSWSKLLQLFPHNCVNEFFVEELDKSIDDYSSKIFSDSNFYPWHIGGMVFCPHSHHHHHRLIYDCRNSSEDISKCLNFSIEW
eukprot:CAMPEP_0170523756 /NCGR_PEP_ID=MMETSP0209-20121228/9196_1 /TAXON_ID=665100 ORGANISM="Litonotus pictus, Strain P1" /NCGR_SAMPLE_ID=MMETSP0209 /ASSEMBLY_ACC=CAM_ASM_000301 /LENGTH=407 /DNA_ID=CAMNT_0010812035 /DNA_START=10 /DNA_END=1230 /DNA_ORIENTATION=-